MITALPRMQPVKIDLTVPNNRNTLERQRRFGRRLQQLLADQKSYSNAESDLSEGSDSKPSSLQSN